MIERFQGENGKRLLREAILTQVIVNGEMEIAFRLVDAAQLLEFSSGEKFISQDSAENDLFFIVSGSVRIEANGRVVAIRKAGTHVGEMALIDCKAKRSANVFAAESTVVAKVSEPVFTEIAEQYPVLWRRIAIELCDRLRYRNQSIRPPNDLPHVFICSSRENLEIAEQLQLKLDHHKSQVKVWTDNVFQPMKHTIEDLEREVETADFAVVLVMPDDIVQSRKKKSAAPRDNVVFELGLFMGQLGRERTLIVSPRGLDLKMPSDLLGLKPLTFEPPSNLKESQSLTVSLASVCTELRNHIDKIGVR